MLAKSNKNLKNVFIKQQQMKVSHGDIRVQWVNLIFNFFPLEAISLFSSIIYKRYYLTTCKLLTIADLNAVVYNKMLHINFE